MAIVTNANIATYENFVLENKMTNDINTHIDVNALFTLDNSLEQSAGLIKYVNKYTYKGDVEELQQGAKNSARGSVEIQTVPYEVKRYQHTFGYNDRDVMRDPYVLDVMTNGAAIVVADHIREQYFEELAKIPEDHTYEYTGDFGYTAVVDGLAKIGREVESDQIIVLGLDMRAEVRKDPDFIASRMGEILYTGQFGTICGVPVVCSKLVTDGLVYITAKDQIKLFVKKNGTVEQDRDIETKDNTVVYERHGVMALVDDTKSMRLRKKA